jgi:hypothetical protein
MSCFLDETANETKNTQSKRPCHHNIVPKLQSVEKRVKDSASEIDKKEWDNISQFLRQVYGTGEDMKSVAGGIFDPEKKKQALADSDLLKKYAKAADVPANKADGEGFLTVAAKMDDVLEDFLDQLRDVPDEI